jgi:hypothetical protein
MSSLADTYADLDAHIEGLYHGKLVPEDDVRRLCEKAKEILQGESNVVPVRAPITVVRAHTPAACLSLHVALHGDTSCVDSRDGVAGRVGASSGVRQHRGSRAAPLRACA